MNLGDAEVPYLQVAFGSQKNIVGFEVAVQHSVFVKIMQGHYYLKEPIENHLFIKPLALLLLKLDMIV